MPLHFLNHTQFYKKIFGTVQSELLYYYIVTDAFFILLATFEFPIIYRLTHSLFNAVLVHFVYVTWVFLTIALFFRYRLTIKLTTLFRSSICFQILLSIYCLLVYKYLSDIRLLIPWFAIKGALVGLFTTAYHISLLDSVKDIDRDSFLFKFRSLYAMLPVIMPLVGGLIIKFFGFSWLPVNAMLPSGYFSFFIFAGLASLLMLVLSPDINIDGNFTHGWEESVRLFFSKPLFNIRNYLVYSAFIGELKYPLYATVGFVILKEELHLGSFYAAVSLLGVLCFYYISKQKEKLFYQRFKLCSVGLVGNILGQIALLVQTNFIGLLLRSLATILMEPFRNVFSQTIVNHTFDKLHSVAHINNSSFCLLLEICYYVGRVLSFAAFTLLLTFIIADTINLFKYVIAIVILLDMGQLFFLNCLHTKV